LDQAKLTVTAAEATFFQARQDLILRVTQAYFERACGAGRVECDRSQQTCGVEKNLAQAKRDSRSAPRPSSTTTEAQARYDQIVAQEQVARGDLIVKRYACAPSSAATRAIWRPCATRRNSSRRRRPMSKRGPKRAEENNPNVAVAQASAQIARHRYPAQSRRSSADSPIWLPRPGGHAPAQGSSTSSVPF